MFQKVNLTDVAGRVEDAGRYTVFCDKAEPKRARSGNLCINCEFTVHDHESASGARLYDTFTITPNALWKLRRFMEATGQGIPQGDIEIKRGIFEGRVCAAEVEYRPSGRDGRLVPQIVNYAPLGEAAKASATGAEDFDF